MVWRATRRLRIDAGAITAGAFVVVDPLVSDVAAASPAKAEELALCIGGLVAGKLANAPLDIELQNRRFSFGS